MVRRSQVWNVVDGKPVANFGGHGGRLMACTWNALEADTAVTGGEDSCLRVWNVSRQSHKVIRLELSLKFLPRPT